jgi:hypothetical protein
MTVSNQLLVSTRKGLFTIERSGSGRWRIARTAFLSDNVSMVLPDPRDGSVYAALEHGHFGTKLHRSPDGGATWETNWIMTLTRDDGAGPAPARADAPGRRVSTSQGAGQDGRRDFDFIVGRWRVANQRLVQRLQGCSEWATFQAVARAQPLPGGLGNIDEFATDHWPGFVGMTLRLYNAQTRRWSLYWVNNQTGLLQPSVVGSFADGVGRSWCATSGRTSPRPARAGSRRSRRTRAAAGRPTGS